MWNSVDSMLNSPASDVIACAVIPELPLFGYSNLRPILLLVFLNVKQFFAEIGDILKGSEKITS
jgi:hypothetical protein